MAAHRLLTREEEADSARLLLQLEVAEWVAVFSCPPLVPWIVHHLRIARGASMPNGWRRLLRLVRRTSRRRGRTGRHDRAALADAAAALGSRLRDVDPDRRLLDAAITLALSLSDSSDCPRDLRCLVRSARYGSYAQSVIEARRATARQREKFVLANLRLVVRVARCYACRQMPLLDVIQEGNIGLLRAVQRFDVRHGCRFSTYATWWIRHAIRRGLAERARMVRLPVCVLEHRSRAEHVHSSFATHRGREPTEEELIDETGLGRAALRAAHAASLDQTLSLDRPVADDDGRRHVDQLVDENAPDPLEEVEHDRWRNEVDRLLAGLPEVEATVLRLRHGLDGAAELTLQEVGDRFGRSRERIRQIEEQAYQRLRRRVGEGL